MQEKQSPVIVVATANDVTQMPPDFLRKGRFDELFFVDLPNQEEREVIWAIQIAKYGCKSESYNCVALAEATDGFTGAEIEQAFIEGLYDAFSRGKEPGGTSLGMLLASQVPLSRLMSEPITTLRQWAKGRARPATTPVGENTARRLAA
jgi:SpoVK/Ycf46/Vps4 family AAA+-type ATPase